jgi:membrane protein YdbS with pleckstrin-like domain
MSYNIVRTIESIAYTLSHPVATVVAIFIFTALYFFLINSQSLSFIVSLIILISIIIVPLIIYWKYLVNFDCSYDECHLTKSYFAKK